MIYSPLHCMQKDHSAYLTNALSSDVFLTAGLIYCELRRIVKTTITGSVTASPIIPSMQKRFTQRKKRGCELQIQRWLRRFCSNLIMWSIISAEAAPHGKESHWGAVWRRLHIFVCTTMIGCAGETRKKNKHARNNGSSRPSPLKRPSF